MKLQWSMLQESDRVCRPDSGQRSCVVMIALMR